MKITFKDRYENDVIIFVDDDGDLNIYLNDKQEESLVCIDQYELKKVLKFANENPEPKAKQ